MINLLRTEWLKLKHYTPFWVVTALYPICVGGIVALTLGLQNWWTGDAQRAAVMAGRNPFAFPYAWQTVGWLASWMQFFPALLIILNVTNEFTFRSHRQNLLEGWSRPQFLGAKILVSLALSTFCTAVVAILAIIAAAVNHNLPSPDGLQYLAIFALQTFCYTVFALVLAFLIRRSALAVAAFSIYTGGGEFILKHLLNYRLSGVGNYLPLEVVNQLLPLPFVRDATKALPNASFFTSPPDAVLLGAAAFYLALFFAILWEKFRNEDL